METIKNFEGKSAIEKIQALLVNTSTGMLISSLQFKNPSVCPMTVKTVDEQGNIWFLTHKNSEHYNNIEENNRVLLTFSSEVENEYLSITGEAFHTDDAKVIDVLWDEADGQWYKNGREDKNVAVLQVRVEDAYYWDSYEQKSKSIA
ncbi:MAG TPA: pyridoxamine 5'-phosphate oxidase family protein [Flavobacteriaceae bacterium]|nr:pyridoxamine 5'-phosphate oxidase family protein [Flavobacteriaceae bacterium]